MDGRSRAVAIQPLLRTLEFQSGGVRECQRETANFDSLGSFEQVAKIEATRESEQLKSVLLDAITHDFRTPLTSIKASVTGLLGDLELDREQRKELLIIIDEECGRINRLVGAALEIVRLESGDAKLNWRHIRSEN